MTDITNINSINAVDDVKIISKEFHTHLPYASSSYNNNDEIRIPLNQQDVYTLPSESFLMVKGRILKSDNTLLPTLKKVSNFVAFLFDEIRYMMGGVEIDRVRNVGVTSTMKNIISLRYGEKNALATAGWTGDFKSTLISTDGYFTVYLPLKMLLGFCEDYDRIIVNVKQELVLLRSSTDDCAMDTDEEYKLMLTQIAWKIPHVELADPFRLELLQVLDEDKPIRMGYRKWALYDYPSLPAAAEHTWSVKTTSMMEKPRYMIIGFQRDRKKKNVDSALFDDVGIYNVKLYLNSVYYPYDNINGDMEWAYEMFKAFYYAYYNRKSDEPAIDFDAFKSSFPLFFIDCSKQNDIVKMGTMDIKIEMRKKSGTFLANTTAFCLMISDCVMQYTPLSGVVRPAE